MDTIPTPLLLAELHKRVQEKPDLFFTVVKTCQQALMSRTENLTERITKKDKALYVLFDRSEKNPKNLQDAAEEMTTNVFNGAGKVYTEKDIVKSIK